MKKPVLTMLGTATGKSNAALIREQYKINQQDMKDLEAAEYSRSVFACCMNIMFKDFERKPDE